MNTLSGTAYTDSLTTMGLPDGDRVYEMLAEHMILSLENVRATLSHYIKGLEGAEKAKYEKVKKQVEEYLEQLQKAKKSSGLQKFFKALGGIGFMLAVITAVLIPSPMTIALLVVATALFLEPMISKAAGADSMLEQGMAAMFKSMSDSLGVAGAAVMASLIMITIAVAATAAVGAGMSMLGSATSATVQSIKTFIQEMPQMIMKFFGSQLTESGSRALRTFLEVAQSSIVLAQSGLQIDIARLNFEVAKLVKEYNIDQALIDGWIKTLQILTQETSQKQEFLGYLESLLPGLFDRPNR